MRCAAPCRAISGCSSVMRERKSFWIFLISFVETVDNFVDNFEESLLFGEAKAVIDAYLRFNVLHRLAVAAI
jgi:hypothetical protein